MLQKRYVSRPDTETLLKLADGLTILQFAQAVDFYLTDAGSKHLPEINKIACQPSSPESDALLLGYCMEGIRLAGTAVRCA
jgi:hypothetical protein